MTKNDKELIYDLLKKADANVNGFIGEGFKGEVVFEDEIVGASPTMTQSPVVTEVTTAVPEFIEGQAEGGLTLSDLYSKISLKL